MPSSSIPQAQTSQRILSIRTVEEQVWKRENIRIVIRLPAYVGIVSRPVAGYEFVSPLLNSDKIDKFCQRLKSVLGHPIDFMIVLGTGSVIDCRPDDYHLHQATLGEIRKSYIPRLS